MSSERIITLQKSLFLYTFLCDLIFFSVAKEWTQFRQKSPWCVEAIPFNNADSFFTGR